MIPPRGNPQRLHRALAASAFVLVALAVAHKSGLRKFGPRASTTWAGLLDALPLIALVACAVGAAVYLLRPARHAPMPPRLVHPLCSQPDHDEFQFDTMLVFVHFRADEDRAMQLRMAEPLLPVLEADVERVQAFARSQAGEPGASVVAIHLFADGAARYDATVHDEGEILVVARRLNGDLSFLGAEPLDAWLSLRPE